MFLAFQGLRASVRVLPEAAVARLGSLLGALVYAAAPQLRRLTHQHLDEALGLPGKERRRVARQVFDHFGRTFMEWLWLPRLSNEQLQRLVRCEGLEHLRGALAQGHGVILVTPHFGNWEVLVLCLGSMGFPGAVLARRLRYPEYESFLIAMRQARGVATLERSSVKAIAQVLRRNHIVGLLPDQDMDALDGIFVPFFGRPAHTPVGPAALSLMTRAPLVPCFAIREGRGFRLVVEPPIQPSQTTDRAAAIRELTLAWSAVFERTIRRYPGQWVWMHRRWKTQPAVTRVAPSTVAGMQDPRPAFAFAVALMALSLLGVAGCGGPKMTAAKGQGPDQEMDTFTLNSYRADDTRKWQLEGQGASVEGKVISVAKPNGIGFDQTRSARMTAGVAMINQDTRDIRLEYEATIHTSDGLWFTSPILYWIPDAHRFETDNPVRIETDRLLLRGRGSHGDTALKQAVILRDIELVFSPEEGPSPLTGAPATGPRHVTITCDGPLDFDYEHDIATFHHNVRVQDPSGDLYSDLLIAYLDPATRGIRYAEATGRVRIVQQQNTATSTKAVYDPRLGKVTLIGRPSLLVYPSGHVEPSLGLTPSSAVSAPSVTGAMPAQASR